jgi:hypothetical protein
MLILFLLTAAVYGWIEAFAMENGFHVGASDFCGFVKRYHGAMLALVLLIGFGFGELRVLPWWILVEDASFFASSKWGLDYKFKLTRDSWIARMMGSIVSGRIMVPVVYLFLFALGFVTVCCL